MTIEAKLDELIAAVRDLAAATRGGTNVRSAPDAAEAPAKPAKPAKSAASKEPAGPTIEDVRNRLKTLPRNVLTALLARFSSDGKLTSVEPSKFAALLAESEQATDVPEAGDDPLNI